MSDQSRLRVVSPESDPPALEWDIIHIPSPGAYRYCLPNRVQALALKDEHPSGYLAQVAGKLVWIERLFGD